MLPELLLAGHHQTLHVTVETTSRKTMACLALRPTDIERTPVVWTGWRVSRIWRAHWDRLLLTEPAPFRQNRGDDELHSLAPRRVPPMPTKQRKALVRKAASLSPLAGSDWSPHCDLMDHLPHVKQDSQPNRMPAPAALRETNSSSVGGVA